MPPDPLLLRWIRIKAHFFIIIIQYTMIIWLSTHLFIFTAITYFSFFLTNLESAIIKSYTPTIKYRSLDKKPMFNIRDWLLPHISGKMQGHSKPHNFRFYKTHGTAYMQYMQWCTDSWQPSDLDENGEQVPGLKCLKVWWILRNNFFWNILLQHIYMCDSQRQLCWIFQKRHEDSNLGQSLSYELHHMVC